MLHLFNCKSFFAYSDSAVQTTVMRPDVALLASYCKEQVPRSCDHHILKNNSRPCYQSESFLSSGNSATIELTITEATALRYAFTII